MGIGPGNSKMLAEDLRSQTKASLYPSHLKLAEHWEHEFEKKEDDIARLEKNADKTKEMNMKIKELRD